MQAGGCAAARATGAGAGRLSCGYHAAGLLTLQLSATMKADLLFGEVSLLVLLLEDHLVEPSLENLLTAVGNPVS